MWAHGFRVSFTPLPRFFSPFPHGTSSLSVARSYLALGGGPPRFKRDSSCPALLGVMTKRPLIVPGTGLSPSLAGLPRPFPYHEPSPAPAAAGAAHAPLPSVRNACRLARTQFGLFPVRSPLLGESLLFSFPRGTEMFQFPRCPPRGLCIQPPVSSHDGRGVPPFGDPRIHACVRLPEAFRCSPRPSSAPGAKASPVRPSHLILRLQIRAASRRQLGRSFGHVPKSYAPSLASFASLRSRRLFASTRLQMCCGWLRHLGRSFGHVPKSYAPSLVPFGSLPSLHLFGYGCRSALHRGVSTRHRDNVPVVVAS